VRDGGDEAFWQSSEQVGFFRALWRRVSSRDLQSKEFFEQRGLALLQSSEEIRSFTERKKSVLSQS